MSVKKCVQQSFLSSPHFHAFMIRPSCVHHTFLPSCPEVRAFVFRRLCVQQTFLRSSDYSCVHDQISVRSTDCSFVQDQTFVLSSDFRAFFRVSRLCNFERPSCVHLNARLDIKSFCLGLKPGSPKTNRIRIKSNRHHFPRIFHIARFCIGLE